MIRGPWDSGARRTRLSTFVAEEEKQWYLHVISRFKWGKNVDEVGFEPTTSCNGTPESGACEASALPLCHPPVRKDVHFKRYERAFLGMCPEFSEVGTHIPSQIKDPDFPDLRASTLLTKRIL